MNEQRTAKRAMRSTARGGTLLLVTKVWMDGRFEGSLECKRNDFTNECACVEMV